jgi:hypothetical protein
MQQQVVRLVVAVVRKQMPPYSGHPVPEPRVKEMPVVLRSAGLGICRQAVAVVVLAALVTMQPHLLVETEVQALP